MRTLFALLSISVLATAQWSSGDDANNNNNNNNFQNEGRRGVVNSVLSPQNLNNVTYATHASGGVSVQFQLRSYSNPSLALPNGNTCVCPAGFTCTYMGKIVPECYFSFTFIISAPDQSVRYFATEFISIDSNGQLSDKNGKRWDENYVVQLPSKPSAIDVFVHHMGAVINQRDGSPVQMDALTHVDTFVVPLSDELPVVGGVGSMQQSKTFTGKQLSTQLAISFSISCTGDLIGPDCDLSCVPSKIANDISSCKSNATGYYSVCKKANNGQVSSCTNCPWGVRDNTYCQDENGKVLDPAKAGVVDGSWKWAAIVLAFLTALLFILFVIMTVLFCRSRKSPENENLPGHNYRTSQRTHDGHANAPLLQASFNQDAALPPHPQAAPRSQPNLDAKPVKSALRSKPPMVPPAHLGGCNSINDSLNSSFMSEVPMRPSRSEVV